MPMIEDFKKEKRTLKFFEIGLGCGMSYGPGASMKLWQKLFKDSQVDLWMADVDAACVEKYKQQLAGINVLIGDQGNKTVLADWVE